MRRCALHKDCPPTCPTPERIVDEVSPPYGTPLIPPCRLSVRLGDPYVEDRRYFQGLELMLPVYFTGQVQLNFVNGRMVVPKTRMRAGHDCPVVLVAGDVDGETRGGRA